MISIKTLLKDAVGWSLFQFARPFLNFYIPRRAWLARVRDLLDNYGISIVPHHYYEPVYTSADLIRDPSAPRALDGIDWNDEGQLKLLGDFRFADDLRQLEGRAVGGNVFRYDNGAFEAGDAEALYCMIRQFKPKNFVEIGCGQSTLVAQFAFEDCAKDDPAYRCRHVCFEPFENPWLDSLGIQIRRERIERSELALFRELDANDVVFIDSSHALRPMGDVEFEYLHMLPVLRPGVIVHAHDIFSPRDYPREWLEKYRRLWTEQYLLEAFLSFNSEFETLCAMNYLKYRRPPQMDRAFPLLLEGGYKAEPGSFWFRRRPSNQDRLNVDLR